MAAAFAPRAEASSWDQNVRRLCSSIHQDKCWIKAFTIICDREQIDCTTLPDNTPARVIRKVGDRWYVETPERLGWVNARMMMLHGPAMR